MKQVTTIACVFLMSFTLNALAQDDSAPEKVVRIEFEDQRSEGVKLNMSLPITLLASLEPQIEEALRNVHFEDHDIDLVELWESVKEAGPTEFVSIKSEEADVSVSTTETHVLIKVNEKKEGHDINVKLPLALGDALLANNGNFDYQSALSALLAMEGQDLIVISGKDVRGRVWIE